MAVRADEPAALSAVVRMGLGEPNDLAGGASEGSQLSVACLASGSIWIWSFELSIHSAVPGMGWSPWIGLGFRVRGG